MGPDWSAFSSSEPENYTLTIGKNIMGLADSAYPIAS
jgi:hypothetical protein